MIAVGNFLTAIAGVLHSVIVIFYFLFIARVILSWVSPDPRNPLVQFIYSTTEPVLARIRSRIPPAGFIDLSPIVVFLVLYFVDAWLVMSLADYGEQAKIAAKGGTF